jgi:fructose-bisphosphate aldolase, class I
VAPGKGLLAADESFGTIEKRFKAVGIPSTEENRRNYRNMLFGAPGLGHYVSGVILFDETIRQKAADGTPLVEVIKNQGMVPGIKVDKGAKPLANFPGEKITEGLDGLRERFTEYYQLGARFAKWRAVIAIGQADNGERLPTGECIAANAQALARYAALSQEANIVPIVEPEVLMDGDHGIELCQEATEATQRALFLALAEQRVVLECLLLKPNMVLPGIDSPKQAGVEQVAKATVESLRRTVPAAVPGVMFLSGGQDEVLATKHLNAMNRIGEEPWQLGFSFARALQEPALRAWKGEPAKVQAAQQAILHRARLNSAARYGKYSEDMEKQTP